MTIKELRELTGLSQNAFSGQYCIPKKTLQNWEQGQRKCPDYVLYMLERLVKEVDYKEGDHESAADQDR